MQSQPTPTPSREQAGSLPRTPLASCLALALSLSAPSTAILASDRGLDQHALLVLRASKATRIALEPDEVFANIQEWRADHPRPQQPANTLRGSTHVVTNCNNEGAGSLRENVANAASGDIIDMSSLECDVIVLDLFLPIGQDNLTLRGSVVSGAPHPSIQPSDSGANTTGLLVHYGAGTLTVDSLWLRSGTKYGDGGCVRSQGSVTIGRSMVTDCEALSIDNFVSGGGIYAVGWVILVDSVISRNSTHNTNGSTSGGGVYAKTEFRSKYSVISENSANASGQGIGIVGGVVSRGNTIVLGSTIHDNDAYGVGGLKASGTGDILVRSSTISGNSSSIRGSAALALFTYGGAITITDTTVTDNHIVTGGPFASSVGLGIYGSPISVSVNNSIVSGNADDSSQYDFRAEPGIAVSGNYNLLGTHMGNTPTHIHQENAPLGPLADNGGPTPTHAIDTGSWAFNQGQTSATQDQRGMPRPVGTGDDIGAFESDALFIGRFEDPPLG